MDQFCEGYPPQRWLGVAYGAQGLVYAVIYVPCIIAMWTEDLIKMSCYKIMFVMSLFDMMALVNLAGYVGVVVFAGITACQNPALNLFVAGLGNEIWLNYCALCVTLALNRWADLHSSALAEQLFHGKRVYLWIGVTVMYGLTTAVSVLAGESRMMISVQFYGTYIFEPEPPNSTKIAGDVMHTINNFGMPFVLLIIYILISIEMIRKYSGHAALSVVQKQVMIQSVVLCSLTMFTGYFYVVMMDWPTLIDVKYMPYINSLWMSCHGANGIIYLTFNTPIRRAVKKLIFGSATTTTAVTPVGPNLTTNRATDPPGQHHQQQGTRTFHN